MDAPKILYFDIETCPCLTWAWASGKQYVGAEQILEDAKIICISYKWSNKPKIHSLRWDLEQCDKQMLLDFHEIADQADVVIGHNGKNFDVRHVQTRIAYHRITPLTFHLIEDTLLKSRPALRLPSYKLSYLAKYFQVGSKMETGGIKLWMDVWLKNDREALGKMVKYCEQDVHLLEDVHNEMRPYIGHTLNLSTFYGDAKMCPSCGGKLIGNGTRMISQLRKVHRLRCKQCGKSFTEGRNLLKNTADYPR